jgi:hypothetical protein
MHQTPDPQIPGLLARCNRPHLNPCPPPPFSSDPHHPPRTLFLEGLPVELLHPAGGQSPPNGLADGAARVALRDLRQQVEIELLQRRVRLLRGLEGGGRGGWRGGVIHSFRMRHRVTRCAF